MSKLLIALIFLLIGEIGFSQDTTTIKNSTLDKIIKDLDKCDSLRVAYDQKSIIIDSLTVHNINLFTDLKEQNNERIILQEQLNEKFKPQKNTKPILIYGVAGIIIGVLISK